MEDRRTTQGPSAQAAAETIMSRATAAGVTVNTLAEATGLPVSNLDAFLSGNADIEVESLLKVGGFLALGPADLFTEVAA